MKKKIKDCSLAEFCSNNDTDNYPLLAIMRHYFYRSNYGYAFKNNQWKVLKRCLDKDFLNKEIEVKENLKEDTALQAMIDGQYKKVPKELRDIILTNKKEVLDND